MLIRLLVLKRGFGCLQLRGELVLSKYCASGVEPIFVVCSQMLLL